MKSLKYTALLFLILSAFNVTSQRKVNPNIQYKLAFKINPTAGSGVITYAIIGIDTLNNNRLVKTQFLTEGNFVKYGKGINRCIANPTGINYYEKFEVDCGLMLDDPTVRKGIPVQDTLFDEMAPLCLPIYDIWKLRYSVHPHYGTSTTNLPDEDKGWATTRYRPSYKQTLLLQQYGVNNVTDFFYGDNMFRLFKDMQNEEWVETYKGLLD
jgi:hypothetical protein